MLFSFLQSYVDVGNSFEDLSMLVGVTVLGNNRSRFNRAETLLVLLSLNQLRGTVYSILFLKCFSSLKIYLFQARERNSSARLTVTANQTPNPRLYTIHKNENFVQR